jgi:hypothetical protein
MWTDCCFYFPLSKDLVPHRPNFRFAFNVSLPCASRVLGQHLQCWCWLPQQDSSTWILQQNLREIILGPCLRTGKSSSDGDSFCQSIVGKAMLNDHQHEARRDKAGHFSPASLDDIERRPMFVYTLHLVRLLASTL